MEKEKLAFELEERGYSVKAWFLKGEGGEALVEIKKGDCVIREFKFPAYKRFNIAAHFSDIIDSEISKNQLKSLQKARDAEIARVLHAPDLDLTEKEIIIRNMLKLFDCRAKSCINIFSN